MYTNHPVTVERILELADKMNIRNGKPSPEHLNPPTSILSKAKAIASSVFKKYTLHYGTCYLTNGNVSTSWKCNDTTGWFILDAFTFFCQPATDYLLCPVKIKCTNVIMC